MLCKTTPSLLQLLALNIIYLDDLCCGFFAFKQKIETLEHRMYTHSLHNDPSLESLYNLCKKKAQVTMKCHY